MTKKEEKEAKSIMVEKRGQGASKTDCADWGGIDRTTLYRWLDDDATFATRFSQAWKKFKLRTLVKTQDKDPKFILSKIDKRFKEEEKDQGTTNNILIIGGDDKLADRLTSIVGWLNTGGDNKPTTKDAGVGEAEVISGDSSSGKSAGSEESEIFS